MLRNSAIIQKAKYMLIIEHDPVNMCFKITERVDKDRTTPNDLMAPLNGPNDTVVIYFNLKRQREKARQALIESMKDRMITQINILSNRIQNLYAYPPMLD